MASLALHQLEIVSSMPSHKEIWCTVSAPTNRNPQAMADGQISLFILVRRVICPDRCGQWINSGVSHRGSFPSGLGQMEYPLKRLMSEAAEEVKSCTALKPFLARQFWICTDSMLAPVFCSHLVQEALCFQGSSIIGCFVVVLKLQD